MRFLIILLLIVAGIVGLGFYSGWFAVSAERSPDKSNVTLTVDKDKAKQDARDAKQKVQGTGDEAPAPADKK